MTVDDEGILQAKTTVGSSFSAILPSDSTMQNSIEYFLINWNELHDDSDNYDPVAGVYSAPEDGVYLFTVKCSWARDEMDIDDAPIIVRFRVNGYISPLGQLFERVTIRSNYGEDVLFSLTTRLLTGDMVSVAVLAITGGPTILLRGGNTIGVTFISGTRID